MICFQIQLLVNADLQHIQLAASNVVQQVLTNGRNLNQALDESLRRKSAWTPAQRAALQDLSYGTLRFYGQLNAILGLLLHKPLTDERLRYLLLVALYQLQYSKAATCDSRSCSARRTNVESTRERVSKRQLA